MHCKACSGTGILLPRFVPQGRCIKHCHICKQFESDQEAFEYISSLVHEATRLTNPTKENTMHFMQAISEARNGKKIQIVGEKDVYFFWDDEKLVGSSRPHQPARITAYMLDSKWKIYQETHDWNWAWGQLRIGKGVKRLPWSDDLYVFLNDGGVLLYSTGHPAPTTRILDSWVHTEDWILA